MGPGFQTIHWNQFPTTFEVRNVPKHALFRSTQTNVSSLFIYLPRIPTVETNLPGVHTKTHHHNVKTNM